MTQTLSRFPMVFDKLYYVPKYFAIGERAPNDALVLGTSRYTSTTSPGRHDKTRSPPQKKKKKKRVQEPYLPSSGQAVIFTVT